MANVRTGNVFYIDTNSGSGGATLAEKNLTISQVILTPTATNCQLVLKDVTTGAILLDLQWSDAKQSKVFPLGLEGSPGISFPNGVDPTTVSNCVAMLILRSSSR